MNTLAYNALRIEIFDGGRMALPDRQKLAYLQQMGIQAYYPRRALPGARPSVHYAGNSLPAAATRPALRETLQGGADAALEALAAVVPAQDAERAVATPEPVSVPAVSSAAGEPEPVPPAVEPEVAADQALRFAFAYIPVNEHLAVINELPWTRSANLSQSCRKLLADILKALKLPVEERNLNPMIFTWPLFDDVQMHGDSARQTLEGFLARRLRLQPVRHLFVFAEQAAAQLFPADFALSTGAFFRHPRFEVEVCVTHSLNAMDAVPELKRPVWDLLKPLQGRLDGSAPDTADES